ncbi:putative Ig domain-containing protein [Mucilaginibacter sp.]|uniref:NHL domain-containing protein n=1 Tax=Mucilaginibacter sp. TaxID=1882438 RepID=UPI0025F7091F|nr:putative Ig domain-containing protein [Mucilaginibacter sp.]
MKMIKNYLTLMVILAVSCRVAGQAPSVSYTNAVRTLIPGVPFSISPSNSGGAVPATTYGKVTTFAGSPSGTSGYYNASDTTATFNFPQQMIKDVSGNMYVADANNNAIRKITPAGVVTTFAGDLTGLLGLVDGTGTAALFNYPDGIAIDGSGNLFVSDYTNNAIRKITPGAVVTTFYISAGTFGPGGLCFDNSGNLIVTAQDASQIISISPSGVATVLAGSSPGYVNGSVGSAQFNTPTDVRVDGSGNIYVVDFENNAIRKITPAGAVTTIAGSDVDGNTPGYADGVGTAAVFNNPTGLALGPGGVIYVADLYDNDIRRIMPDGTVSLLAGNAAQVPGDSDGTGSAAGFNLPVYIYIDNAGTAYVAELLGSRIRKVSLTGYTLKGTLPTGLAFDASTGTISGTPTGSFTVKTDTLTAWNASGFSTSTITFRGVPPVISYDMSTDTIAVGVPFSVSPINTGGDVPATTYATVSTTAGSTSATSGYTNATGTSALFSDPSAAVTDAAGIMYIADAANNAIRKIDLTGAVSTFAGSSSGISGFTDGQGTSASFNAPSGITLDVTGNLLVSDYGNNAIRKITPDGTVTTFYHSTGTFGPAGLTIDGAGNIVVAAKDENQIVSITPSAVATTLAGSTSGYTNGTGTAAQFNSPTDVKIDVAGNFFVADYLNNAIREIDPTGVVTTFAGSNVNGNTGGYQDSVGTVARFNKPKGLAIAPGGVIYVADFANNVIRRILPDGTVSLAAGSTSQTAGNSDGIDSAATFNGPSSVYIDNLATGYVTEAGGNRVRKIILTGYSLAGTLPSGLSLDATTGVISGTATALVQPVKFSVIAFNTAGISLALPPAGATNDWTGGVSTLWNVAGNWSAGVPTPAQTARIGVAVAYLSTRQPTVNIAAPTVATLAFGALAPAGKPVLTISSGNTLTATNGFTIAASTGVTVNGPGKLTLGSNSQITAASQSFAARSNLTITLNATSFITNTSGGTFTLGSDANGSASIAAIPATSGINGPVSVERFISGGVGFRGYRDLTSPVFTNVTTNGNVYSINYVNANPNGTYTTGGAGGGFDVTGNPTLYLFREDVPVCNSTFTCGNWQGIANITAPPQYTMDPTGAIVNIPVGISYLCFFRGQKPNTAILDGSPFVSGTKPEPATFVATGTLNRGPITVKDWFSPATTSLSYSVITGNSTIRGEHFVGNPYACTIDLSTYSTSVSTSGIYAPNTSTTVIENDAISSSYGNWNTALGIGTNTAGQYIQSGAGFFVTASSGSASVTFNENAKIPSQQVTIASGFGVPMDAFPAANVNRQYLRLEMNADTQHHEDILIWFDDSRKVGFEPAQDGLYMRGYNTVSLSSSSSDNVPLGINMQPLPVNERRIIGLNVDAANSGAYHFNLKEVVGLPKLYDVWLLDTYKKDSVNLRTAATRDFVINKADSASFGSKRFSLVIKQNPSNAYRLLDFTANKISQAVRQVRVAWKTVNEENDTYFTVERSTDGGQTFAALGSLNSSGQGEYDFVDNTPVIGQNLYRLKQADLNNVTGYSKSVLVKYDNLSDQTNGAKLIIYPNPVKGEISLAIKPATSEQAVYKVSFSNAMGAMLKQFTLSQTTWQGNVSELLPGTYMVRIVDNKTKGLVAEGKFVKL